MHRKTLSMNDISFTSAATMASHLSVVLLVGVFIYSLLHCWRDGLLPDAVTAGLPETLSFALFMLAIERSYYFTARATEHTGLDLWSAHPAPEMLSAGLAIGMFVTTVPLMVARRGDAWKRHASINFSLFVVVWLAVFAVLI